MHKQQSVGLVLVRGRDAGQKKQAKTQRRRRREKERGEIHTPSLQRAWTSCPAVRKKRSGGVQCQTNPKGFILLYLNILYSDI